MPEDYQDIVLAAYKKMKDNGKLHVILPRETTTKLRTACLKVYESRYDPKDADILAMFFEVDKMGCDFQKILNKSEADDYRALWNHITGGTETTDERNSDLLAWLIDLEPRPRSSYYLSPDKTIKIGGKPIQDLFLPPSTTPPPVLPDPPKPPAPPKSFYIPRFSPRYITLSCIILLFVCTVSFAVWERRAKMVRMPELGEKFMYWDGDHYEPIKEGEQKAGVPIIKLNLQALKRQRRINLHDTMTNYSVGKVWHIKIGNNPEFYTDSGMHPVDTARRLRPMSLYVHTKYNSYPRYILTHLVWFICAAFLISLGGYGISRIKRKVTVDNQEQKTDDHIADFSEAQLAQ